MDDQRPTRRGLLAAGAGVAAALGGCSSLTGDGRTTLTPAPVPDSRLPSGRLSIRTPLEGGPGRRALADLAAAFDRETRGVDPVVVSPGEAGPPEGGLVDYQGLGATLAPRAKRGRLHTLDEQWRDLRAVVPRGVATTCLVGGDPVAVPQAVHRLNTLFYNPEVLEWAGVSPEAFTTIRDLASDPDRLGGVETAFAAPMASRQDLLALWESLLSARLVFPGQYNDLVTGSPAGSRLTVERATRDFDAALSLLPGDDRGVRALLDGVVGGTVGFVRAPTSAARHLVEKSGAAYGENWAATPVFASPWAVTLVVEGFTIPRATPEQTTPRAFVGFATGPERSRQFSRTYGSLPPRVDVTPAGHPFYAAQARQFRQATMYAPSIAYGQAVRPEIRSRIGGTLAAFREHRDAERASAALYDAFEDSRAL